MSEYRRLPGPWLPGITIDPDGYFHGYDKDGYLVDGVFALVDTETKTKPKRERKTSIKAVVKAAAAVNAKVTLPDGTVFEPARAAEPAASDTEPNEWDVALAKRRAANGN